MVNAPKIMANTDRYSMEKHVSYGGLAWMVTQYLSNSILG
jgi:hypothetical protein